MKTVNIQCGTCDCIFSKSKREYDRQVRNGKMNFYCSRSCVGKANSKNLGKHLGVGNISNLKPNNRNDQYTPFRHYMKRIRTRHVENGKKYDIDVKYLKEIWEIQSGKCALTGVNLITESKVSNPNFSASVDRIDSSLGYVKNNIQWVSVTVNFAKNSYSTDVLNEFFDIVKKNTGVILDSTGDRR